ncbi:MAG: ROK family protein [Deltaproteobacteria bacterium]
MAERQKGGSAEVPTPAARAQAGRLAIGIDLGGTNARAAVIDWDGKVLSACKRPLADRAPEAVADLLAVASLEALRQAKRNEAEVVALGVGAAGQIHSGTGVVAVGPNLGWRDVPFAALLGKRLSWPVLLMNDLSAASWGERSVGAGESEADVLLYFVGTGVGSGLILNGRLYEGSGGVAGEVGHTKVVVPGGRLCGCGEHGCLEAYCGGHNLSMRVAEALGQGRESTLARAAAAGPVRAADIEQAALSGDMLARELWDECARLLSVSLANYVTVLNPARVILGGGVLLTCPELRRTLVERTFELALRASRPGLQIVEARLGDDAGVVGSGLRALESVLP